MSKHCQCLKNPKCGGNFLPQVFQYESAECGCPDFIDESDKCGKTTKTVKKCDCANKDYIVTSVIEIHQGKLFGKICEDLNGRSYKSFQGIPYAKPSVGILRFMPPVPPESWGSEILDCTVERNACYASHEIHNHPVGNENCLFLNVYTPYLPEECDIKFPVMVWIHGGKFNTGSGNTDIYGPEYLVAKDVVLVTLNYRLGYFGFLKLNDPAVGVTGNSGMKDQVQALRWIKYNIEFFGGDRNNVTIFGSSAGGAAVHLLTLSPIAKGLFHKAIIQSGVALCPWAMQIRKDYDLARSLGCKSTEDSEILRFLEQIKPERFVEKENDVFPMSERMVGEIATATPTIEPPIVGAFLSERVECKMNSGSFNHVPIMIGVNKNEGLAFLNPKLFPKINPQFVDNSLLIPRDLKNFLQSNEQMHEFGDRIKQFYYKDECPSLGNIDSYVSYFTDVAFAQKVQLVTKLYAKHNCPVYNYCISLDTPLNGERLRFGTNYRGTNHYDEVTYLFKTPESPCIVPHTPEAVGVHIMTTYWTNFAKTSNPNLCKSDSYINVEWKPYSLDEPYYLDIDVRLQLKQNLFKDRLRFWECLYTAAAMNKSLVKKKGSCSVDT